MAHALKTVFALSVLSALLAQSAFAAESAPLKHGDSLLSVPVSELSQTPVVKPQSSRRAQVVVKPMAVVVKKSVVAPTDSAADALKACMMKESMQKKSAITCMNAELRAAETLIDSAEVRLFNCAELRKIQKAGDPEEISQLVLARREQLRERDEAQFKSELEAAGKVGPRKKREIELRATLSHLDSLNKLNKKVCDAEAFTGLLAK